MNVRSLLNRIEKPEWNGCHTWSAQRRALSKYPVGRARSGAQEAPKHEHNEGEAGKMIRVNIQVKQWPIAPRHMGLAATRALACTHFRRAAHGLSNGQHHATQRLSYGIVVTPG